MNSFFTGQVVVCITPPGTWFFRGVPVFGRMPEPNEMCVIRGIDSTGDGLLLVGHNQKLTYPNGTEVGFHYSSFRPLVQYKNDISVFKALLAPTKEARPRPVPHTSRP